MVLGSRRLSLVFLASVDDDDVLGTFFKPLLWNSGLRLLLLAAVFKGVVLSSCPDGANRDEAGGIWFTEIRVCGLTNCGGSMSLGLLRRGGTSRGKLVAIGGNKSSSKRSRAVKSKEDNDVLGNELANELGNELGSEFGDTPSLLGEGLTNKLSKSDLFDFEFVGNDLDGSLTIGTVETITSRGGSAFLKGLAVIRAKAAWIPSDPITSTQKGFLMIKLPVLLAN